MHDALAVPRQRRAETGEEVPRMTVSEQSGRHTTAGRGLLAVLAGDVEAIPAAGRVVSTYLAGSSCGCEPRNSRMQRSLSSIAERSLAPDLLTQVATKGGGRRTLHCYRFFAG